VADHLSTDLDADPAGYTGQVSQRESGTFAAVLPNGRVVWLQVAPSLASVRSVDQVAGLAESSALRRQAATRAVGTAVESLSTTITRDAERLNATRVKRKGAARRRLVATFVAVDRRLSKQARARGAALKREREISDETARRLHTRSVWDMILLASAVPLFAAYGERARPFGPHNLTLWLSQLVWLCGDELVDAMFGAEHESPYPVDAPDTWSYIAPLGNLLGGWWLLSARQHEQFVTGRTALNVNGFSATEIPGTTRFSYRYSVEVDMTRVVASEHAPDFIGFKNVPAVASLASAQWTAAAAPHNATITGVFATVSGSALLLDVTAEAEREPDGGGGFFAPPILAALDVAWIVEAAPIVSGAA
jgi:hypothetical protein